MSDKLTVKQEGFVQDVFTGIYLAQAYRNNYNTENMADKTVWEAASRLMADSKVTARLIELQEVASERNQVTVKSITDELEEARMVAAGEAQGAAMTAASMGKAKVNGLLVDKVDAKLTVVVREDDADL